MICLHSPRLSLCGVCSGGSELEDLAKVPTPPPQAYSRTMTSRCHRGATRQYCLSGRSQHLPNYAWVQQISPMLRAGMWVPRGCSSSLSSEAEARAGGERPPGESDWPHFPIFFFCFGPHPALLMATGSSVLGSSGTGWHPGLSQATLHPATVCPGQPCTPISEQASPS